MEKLLENKNKKILTKLKRQETNDKVDSNEIEQKR
jgi:hypothetical protein